MCLFLSEMIMPTSPASAIVHAKGMDDLMKLQGPTFYSSGLSHHMFVGFRPVLVLQAFITRRKHLLSDHSWTSIPFSIYAASPLQALFTEAFPLAAILERMDILQGFTIAQAMPDAQQILEEILYIFQSLVHREQILHGEAATHRWFPIFPAQSEQPIQFPSISVANYFTHLWAFQVICADSIIKLLTRYPCLSTPKEIMEPEELPSVEMIKQLACWCFRSIKFLIQKEFKLFGEASTSLIIKTYCDMFRAYGDDDPEMVFWYNRVSRILKGGSYPFLESLLGAAD
ncbi:Isoflavone reductase family [Fusarium albosuccineum]|uniref:Isoflavone reductase family n=1 Tax=Fusarium albosuccineum TaxID=1237068 RepID=A0A8H4P931_9HYPO|nr:Isoflavone reductase family [Fusarium albosuccineum]